MGLVDVIGPGTAPESDAGVLSLLGYDPVRDSPGRGVLEAEGIGIRVASGEVAFRLNFATTNGAGTVVDQRVGRSLTTHESEALAQSLTRGDLLQDLGIEATVRATVGHRGVLILRARSGDALSPRVTNADPFYERVGGMGRARADADRRIPEVRPESDDPAAARTATAVNAFIARSTLRLAGDRTNARRAIAGKPVANGILLRNAGTAPSPLPKPWRERWGIAGAAVTEMPVERGIARLIGLADEYVGPMGPDRDAGYRERAKRTLQALSRYPFVYVHLKGPDEPGHDGDAPRKREVIEAIDRSFFGPFFASVDLDRTRIVVTADHATPAILRAHSDDPVPLLLVGARVASATEAVPRTFGEQAASIGILGRLHGSDVMPLLLERSVRNPA